MEGFKKLPKMQSFKIGGSVKNQFMALEKKERKTEEKADIAQDKALVKKGVRQHEGALHKGEPKTELKLKTGGRVKKAAGNVKKFDKASGQYGAKKTAVDNKAIKEAKLFKTPKAAAPSKGAVKAKGTGAKTSKPAGDKDLIKKPAAAKVKNTTAKFKCGGKVKKMAEGRLVDVKDPQALTDKIAREENAADRELVMKPIRALKDMAVGAAKKLSGQGSVSDAERQTLKGSSPMAGQGSVSNAERQDVTNIAKKKGGKVKKYADGGSVFSDEENKWLGGADRTDPIILERMRQALGPKKPAVAPQGSYMPNANPAMDNRDIGMTGGNIDDESKWGNVSPAAAAFNKNIPGAGPAATAPSAPVARPAMRRPNPAMIEDESQRGNVTPQQQQFNRNIPGSGNAYQAPNVEQDSGVAYPQGQNKPYIDIPKRAAGMQQYNQDAVSPAGDFWRWLTTNQSQRNKRRG